MISQSSSVVERLDVTLKVVGSNLSKGKSFLYNWEESNWKYDNSGTLWRANQVIAMKSYVTGAESLDRKLALAVKSTPTASATLQVGQNLKSHFSPTRN